MKKFALFFIFISAAYVYLHIYAANFFTKAGFNKKYSVKIFLILAFISILTLFLRRRFGGEIYETFYLISFIWIGYIFMLSFLILISSVFSFFDIEFKKIFLTVIIVSVVSLFYSIYNAFKNPAVVGIDYVSQKLKRNYKIAFISDIHIDFSFKRIMFSKIVDKISNENPDILIIGGDLVDPGFKIDDYVNKIKEVNFPVIFVFGNHEYYYGFDKSISVAKELNFNLLKDSSFVFDRINIIGISDIKTEQLSLNYVENVIYKEYKKDFFNIIVSHQPLYFKELSQNFDILMLSGHTHCGQIFPFHIFTRLVYSYFCGKYQNKNSTLYVSKGAGTWGPPMRFISKSEILFINLKKE